MHHPTKSFQIKLTTQNTGPKSQLMGWFDAELKATTMEDLDKKVKYAADKLFTDFLQENLLGTPHVSMRDVALMETSLMHDVLTVKLKYNTWDVSHERPATVTPQFCTLSIME